ncbi:hypothetical protein ACOMHN_043066 [Nucella lapillus]
MAAILRANACALGLLILAITVHVIGFATQNWVSAKLESRGIQSIMSANGTIPMSKQIPKGAMKCVGVGLNIGLWKFCMCVNLGAMVQSVPDAGLDQTTEICDTTDTASVVPDWWKAVQALGILSLITAVLGVATMIYSFIGDSKGDRARFLPHILAAVCLLAGVLLLIAVAVFGAEFQSMMDRMMEQMSQSDPMMRSLADNLKQHTSLGYSFALEAVAGVLMVLASFVLALPLLRGGDSFFGSPHNLAV